MKTRLLVLTTLLAATAPGFSQTFTENFDTGLGSFNVTTGNTINGNNFGFQNTNNTGGASPAGELAGIIARTGPVDRAIVGTTNITPGATAATALVFSGEAFLSNVNFNGDFRLGYFNTGNTNAAIALNFSEPTTAAPNLFRYQLLLGTTSSPTFGTTFTLAQNTPFTFSLTYNPGTSTLSGTVNGVARSLVKAGFGTSGTAFDVFGLATGAGSTDSTMNTASTTSFDALTYSVPEPGTAVLALAGLAGLVVTRRNRKATLA